MRWRPEDAPPDIATLREPLRTKALEAANALVEQGYDEDEAIRRGLEQAVQWRTERAPHDVAAVKEDSAERRSGK